ncbi:MAG: prepilin-type N-terminal cleavage/methylation domain-containing protein [Idiomarina sp.]
MQLIRAQRGISLLEMLITLALGLVLLAALTSVFTNTLGVNSRSLKASQLQEETLATLGLIVDDLRRSGYTADFVTQVVDPANANQDFRNSLVVSEHPDEVINSCILFAYDADQNGVDSGSTEAFGYRLRNQQVQRRQGGALCADNGWQGLTSADVIVVDSLQFTLTEVVTGTITEQQVQVRLQAHLQQDPTLSRELTQHVVLRNADF